MPGSSENFFLVIEGLDGSGKTTIARRLARSLQALEYSVYLTFEPHDASAAGLYIRQALTNRITVLPKALALAFALNRMDHSANVIEPLLEGGTQRIIICDRYYLSSLVYQSSDDLSMEQVMFLSEGVRRPDLTVFLDADTDTCFRRMRIRSAVSEEKRDRELFENHLDKTREKYDLAIAFLRARGEKIEKIDANSDDTSIILDQIVIKVSEYGPDWIKPQLSLFAADNSSVDSYSLNGTIHTGQTISTLIAEFRESSMEQPPTSHREFEQFVETLRETVRTRVRQMTIDELGLLFLDYIQQFGFIIIDKMPWTDLSAYELEASLPLGLTQRGTALLLAAEYSHDTITNKILNRQLASVSDFMLVLDPGTPRLADSYSRELLGSVNQDTSLAPAVIIIGRDELADLLFADAISQYRNLYEQDLRRIPQAVEEADSLAASSRASLRQL